MSNAWEPFVPFMRRARRTHGALLRTPAPLLRTPTPLLRTPLRRAHLRARGAGRPASTRGARSLFGGVLVVIGVQALFRDPHDDESVALELRLTPEPRAHL